MTLYAHSTFGLLPNDVGGLMQCLLSHWSKVGFIKIEEYVGSQIYANLFARLFYLKVLNLAAQVLSLAPQVFHMEDQIQDLVFGGIGRFGGVLCRRQRDQTRQRNREDYCANQPKELPMFHLREPPAFR